ncbi:hypothetical protein FSP39_025489 [Pinctada imbricata]|uniref:C-type lectin domain-containing protein n=1 Tax=Pinctada imbricata TaxID=66713 RepID=A0AA88YU43_PINIB|nr:hypothetical protein FSP39_025489 [Pinctada imbricata]
MEGLKSNGFTGEGIWIGLSRQGNSNYRWTGSSSIYVNWANGQPSSSNGRRFLLDSPTQIYIPSIRSPRDCGMLKYTDSGRWYSLSCGKSYPYVCEYAIFKTTTSRQPFVYQPGVLDPAAALFCPKHLNRTKTLMYNTYTRHCFTINIAKTANWYAAKSSCESLGGYLARPREFSDNMFIGFRARGALHYRYKHIWIGLSDTEKEGDYRWTNGDSLNYTNWGFREPTGTPWQNCVAYDRDTDKWDDKDCYLKYGWVCQFGK